MASSQSTSEVAEFDKDRRLEISAGQEFHSRSGTADDYSEKSLRSAALSLRRASGFRFTVRGYRLTREFAYSNGSTTFRTEDTDYVVGATAASDWMFHITPNLSVAPSTGLGVVPFAHSSRSSSPGDSPTPSTNSVGLMWTSGVAVRYGHLVVEQELSGMVGASHEMITTAYMPIMIGWRF